MTIGKDYGPPFYCPCCGTYVTGRRRRVRGRLYGARCGGLLACAIALQARPHRAQEAEGHEARHPRTWAHLRTLG